MTMAVVAERSRRRRRPQRLGLILVLALLAAFIALLSLGVASASITDLIPAFLGNVDENTSFVVNQLRLPRASQAR